MDRPPKAAHQFNRLALRLAGHRIAPLWAVLEHRGRTSGKRYSTPIAPIAAGPTFVVALPWGRRTDWVRNLEAAGGGTIRWRGVTYDCTNPRFVDKDVALAAARGLTRRALQRREFPDGFLQLDRRPVA